MLHCDIALIMIISSRDVLFSVEGGLWGPPPHLPNHHVTPPVCFTGPPPGGLVLHHQSERRPLGVVLSRQIPAPVGEDEGAHHPGGGAGDGEGGGGRGGGRGGRGVTDGLSFTLT